MKLNFPTALLLAVLANLIPGGVTLQAKARPRPARRRVRRPAATSKP